MSNAISSILTCALLAAAPSLARAQVADVSTPSPTFQGAAQQLEAELRESIAELARLRSAMAAEEVPLARELSALEAELSAARAEFQRVSRLLDTRTLDLGGLQGRIKTLEEESRYLANLFGEYLRDLDANLHIAERARYSELLEGGQLALDDSGKSDQEVIEGLLGLVPLSFDRLEAQLGGERFDGAALDPDGVLRPGTFLTLGPVVLFRSADGSLVGSVEQRLNSLEPSVFPFARPADAEAAARVVAGGEGALPIDPTLGNARKIEATQETFLEHVRKGGPVMVPIFALAAAALLVALFKWLSLSFVRTPSRKRLAELLQAVEARDEEAARRRASEIPGPVGRMLRAGVEHIREPRELVEEVLYEHVLTARLKLQRMLPFIAICAASAPLLGLLGTVTGIINTFKMITVFGSGDVKSLSGGISEALITTKFGLIVAIPSLLLHAFLSRKARGVVGRMESAAVSFVNQVSKAHFENGEGAYPSRPPGEQPAYDPELIRVLVNEALEELVESRLDTRLAQRSAGRTASARSADEHAPGALPEAKASPVLVPQPSKREG